MMNGDDDDDDEIYSVTALICSKLLGIMHPVRSQTPSKMGPIRKYVRYQQFMYQKYDNLGRLTWQTPTAMKCTSTNCFQS